jgi:MFS family permease
MCARRVLTAVVNGLRRYGIELERRRGIDDILQPMQLATVVAASVQQRVFLALLDGARYRRVMANAVALASEYSPQRQRASRLMWISCGFTGGAIAGGLISAALIPWRLAIRVRRRRRAAAGKSRPSCIGGSLSRFCSYRCNKMRLRSSPIAAPHSSVR